jgi:NADH pyrophosphatase NudC (nudix superfamily)
MSMYADNVKYSKCPECGYEVEVNPNLDEVTCTKCDTNFYPEIELMLEELDKI